MTIMIGTPCYDGKVTLAYMRSILGLLDALSGAGIQATFQTPSHESLVTRARNHVANAFLRDGECSHLLFIDADIGFEPETALRYLKAERDVVCGIYPVKHLDVEKLRRLPLGLPTSQAEAAALKYTVKFKPGCKVDALGLVEVEYGSTGFMLIRRAVLERMSRAYPDLTYRNAYVNASRPDVDNFAFFDTMIDPETRDYLPEDYAFCKRWTALGGTIHADVASRFSHLGGYVFEGDFPAYLTNLGAGEPE